MAISWKKSVRNPETNRDEWVDDGVTHVGLVMSDPFTNEERVMSDIYVDVTRVLVWNPQTQQPEPIWISSNFELDTRHGTAVKDIDPEILAAHQAEQKAKADAAATARAEQFEREQEEAARRELTAVVCGATVVVSNKHSRNVKPGTTGVVFAIKDGGSGPKAGFKDVAWNTHWSAISNLTALFPGLALDERPVGGWRALRDRVQAEKQAWQKSLPKMGDRVIITASGIEGHIRWQEEERIGVFRLGAPKFEKYTFVNVWEVEVVRPDGTTYQVKPFASTIVAVPEGRKVRENPLKGYPAPFCDIARVVEMGGEWNCYTENGTFLLTVPEETARELEALLRS